MRELIALRWLWTREEVTDILTRFVGVALQPRGMFVAGVAVRGAGVCYLICACVDDENRCRSFLVAG